MYIWSLNNRVKFRTKIPMHCCNINKSRRGGFFFGSPGICRLRYLLYYYYPNWQYYIISSFLENSWNICTHWSPLSCALWTRELHPSCSSRQTAWWGDLARPSVTRCRSCSTSRPSPYVCVRDYETHNTQTKSLHIREDTSFIMQFLTTFSDLTVCQADNTIQKISREFLKEAFGDGRIHSHTSQHSEQKIIKPMITLDKTAHTGQSPQPGTTSTFRCMQQIRCQAGIKCSTTVVCTIQNSNDC